MNEGALLDEMTSVLKAAGIEIRVEPFQEPSQSGGGLCRIHGRKLVLLDARASHPEQARALFEVVEAIGLAALGISGSKLSPGLLSALNRRGKMTWPSRRQAPSLAKAPMERDSKKKHRLADHTTLEVGGRAETLALAVLETHVIEVIRQARSHNEALYPLGGGSNVVVSDDGVRGIVLKLAMTGIDVKHEGDEVLVTAAAGEVWHDFAAQMTEENFAGLECLGGIPGNVGATPIQNVGAYGQEVSETIARVRVLDRKSLGITEISAADCGFTYRGSVFKSTEKDRYVVLAVTFRLKKGGSPAVRYGELSQALADTRSTPSLAEVFQTVISLRKKKSMVLDPEDENHRSCGSFFVNAQVTPEVITHIAEVAGKQPPQFPGEGGLVKVPSAWLIEQAGFHKGYRLGHAGLSTKHTLCIVAHTGALAKDIVEMARHVRAAVETKFSVRLIPEPHFWGFDSLKDGLPV